MGAAPFWIGNVAVANTDATAERVVQLGGRVLRAPEDVPQVGRFAVIADRQGAALQIFTAAGEPMKVHDTTQPGEICWNELATTDQGSAFAFYSELFGWQKIDDVDMGPMGNYLVYGVGSHRLGGIFNKPKDVPMPPSWLYYFQVADLTAAIGRAKAKGAKVLNGPMQVPGGSHIVQMMDPQGVAFSLHEEAKAK
jgi:predicted enzyme related to lactoylglutathione lyase